MLLSLPVSGIGMIIAMCHISGNCPVDIDRLKIVDDNLSVLLQMKGAHPIRFDSSGQSGQSDRFFCVGRGERRRSC